MPPADVDPLAAGDQRVVVHAGAEDRQTPFPAEGVVEGRADVAGGIEGGDGLPSQGLEEIIEGPGGVAEEAVVAAVVAAVAPKPVNVLVGSAFATVAELADMGVRRISVGGALARAAWTGFLQAAHEIAERGTFTALAQALPHAEIDGSF